jgi:O-antigen/teichoic acid export membrane protein
VWYKLKDKTLIGAYISIIGAVLTLIFNYVLIPVWGYMGSALATLIAYGSMMLISYLLGQKYYPIPYPKKAIIGYMGTSIALSFLYFYFFRENYWIGMTIIVLFILTVAKNEKKLLVSFVKR